MTDTKQRVKRTIATLKKLLPILSFIIPFLILYYFYPASFESTWKGRTYYLFFLWLILLETILSWRELKTEKWKLKSKKTFPIIIAALLPTIYVITSQYSAWNAMIIDFAGKCNIGQYWANFMPLTIEYLVFTVFFALILLLEYGISDLQEYAISTLFLGLIGMIYMTDNLYPEGNFTPLQIIVPTTATFAVNVSNFIGQKTILYGITRGMPLLVPVDPQGRYLTVPFAIAWPCAGVDSLLVYSVTILLFFKKSAIPLWQRIVYFMIGAIVTYFINILRIVTIITIAVNGGDWLRFHNYYGQLYSITWIISYPLIVIGSQVLLRKIRNWKTGTKVALNFDRTKLSK